MALENVGAEQAVPPDSAPEQRSGRSRRLSLGAVTVAVLLLVVGGHDVVAGTRVSAPAGSANARRPTPDGAVAEQARRDGVDVDRVVDTVRHRMVAGPSGVLISEDERYRAALSADGFELGRP